MIKDIIVLQCKCGCVFETTNSIIKKVNCPNCGRIIKY